MHSMIRFAVPVVCAISIFVPFAAQAGEFHPRPLNQREVNQQHRIYEGLRNGQISPQEYRNLQQREAAIVLQTRRDVRDGNGFSRYERERLDERLDRLSNSIHRDRRD